MTARRCARGAGLPRPAHRFPYGLRGEAARYAELEAISSYSFLRGASHPEELVRCAADLGLQALDIADYDSLAGAVRVHTAARVMGLRSIVGARLVLADAPSMLVYPCDRAAYGRLSRLLTEGKAERGGEAEARTRPGEGGLPGEGGRQEGRAAARMAEFPPAMSDPASRWSRAPSWKAAAHRKPRPPEATATPATRRAASFPRATSTEWARSPPPLPRRPAASARLTAA